MSDVTRILSQIESGDPAAAELLLPLVYAELRKLAAAKLAQEKPGQTLQATALVHEAYLRLVEKSAPDSAAGIHPLHWNGRGHFFAAAAEAMRRILVESARRKATCKHGGSLARAEFDEPLIAQAEQPEEVLAVHEALDQLAAEDPLAAELVKLHYFAGFSLESAAELLGMSRATAYRLWTYARACLKASIQDEGAPHDSLQN